VKIEYRVDQLDFLRRQTCEQQTKIRLLEYKLKRAEFRRLTAEIDLAIIRNDRTAWAKACAERMSLGLTFECVEAA
jgi:hypothetical protein